LTADECGGILLQGLLLPGNFSITSATLHDKEMLVSKLTRKEEQKILESPPKGTFVLMLVFAALFMVCWLLLYFGRYMVLGPIN